MQSTLDLIGQTPLIALQTMSPPEATIYAKAEFTNPGGSIKARAARTIIEEFLWGAVS